MSVRVSSSRRSGGSSSHTRRSRATVSSGSPSVTSSDMEYATAHAPSRPESATASRARRTADRATSIQCMTSPARAESSAEDSSDHVFVDTMSHPASA